MVGGLTGYERRRALSLLDPSNRKYRPLHESRRYNARGRRIAKLLEKDNWFKRKPEDEEDDSGKHNMSPEKRRRVFQEDEGEQLVGSRQDTTPTAPTLPMEDQVPGLQVSSQWEGEHQFARSNPSSQREDQDSSLQISSRWEGDHQPAKNTPSNQLDQRKTQGKKKMKLPETIGVMFVDQTPGGSLAKRLQLVEDRLARACGYRIRMVELSGTPLQRLLPNTNPWAGQPCGRAGCFTCGQGDEVIQDCKKRNVLHIM